MGISSAIVDAVKDCSVFFVENERTARRYLKKISRDLIINDYEWHTIDDKGENIFQIFRSLVLQGKTIGIMSEAGCPGIADPGQELVGIAHQMNAKLLPLAGPNSIILALMASGMNGQRFQFLGYLPINAHERKKKIKELETESAKKNCTQIFIETPYRNDQLLADILSTAKDETLLCVAADLTAPSEYIATKKIAGWKSNRPSLHKRPAIFLLYSAEP